MKQILIIDDEPDILIMLKKMIERAGYEVEIAENGLVGMGLFKTGSFDMVITDILMPEKEGLEIIRDMKQMNPDLKIIAISGGGRISAASYLESAEIFGADMVFEKPFRQAEITGAIKSLLA